MSRNSKRATATSRRDFLQRAATVAAVGPFFFSSGRAVPKTLKIAKWAHFLPEFDQWFVNEMSAEWGKRNDTQVTVDVIPVDQIRDRAFAEVKTGKGHDLFIFPWPPAEFCQHVIDHDEIYQAVADRVGTIQQLAHRSTLNFKTKTYFAFADFWIPSPLHFFQDYWAEVGLPLGPGSYGSLLLGGEKIKDRVGIPCGLAFLPTLEGNVTLHTILYASRAWEFDGSSVLFNKNVFAQALKYIEALYRSSGSPEQLTWSSAGNVRAMVAHKALQHQWHKSLAHGGKRWSGSGQEDPPATASIGQKRDGSHSIAPRHELLGDLEVRRE